MHPGPGLVWGQGGQAVEIVLVVDGDRHVGDSQQNNDKGINQHLQQQQGRVLWPN